MGFIEAAVNAKAASKQMAFQKEMFSNRYQITMADMAKAGLNPILAATLGGGQAPPGAAIATGGDMMANLPQTVQSARTVGSAVKSAVATASSAASAARIRENERLISDRDTKIGLSPHGVNAYKSSLLPTGLVKQGAYLGGRLEEFENWWNRPKGQAMYPGRQTKAQRAKKFKQFKFKKTRSGASGNY